MIRTIFKLINQDLTVMLLYHPNQTTAILPWLRSFSLPHCKNVSSLSQLRSGVAIAEILTTIIPQKYHNLFLNQIEIGDLNEEMCLNNLQIVLWIIRLCYEDGSGMSGRIALKGYTAQGLYFDQAMMSKFIRKVLMNLKDLPCKPEKSQTYAQLTMNANAPKRKRKTSAAQIQDLSQIANISTVFSKKPQQPNENQTQSEQMQKLSKQPQQTGYKSDRKSKQHYSCKKQLVHVQDNDFPAERFQILINWLQQSFSLPFSGSPWQMMGSLINQMFQNRFDATEDIIKPSHLERGSRIVYKKISDYLLTVERMRKDRVMQLMREVDQGSLTQTTFWNVIDDLYQLKNGKNRAVDLYKSASKSKFNSNNINRTSASSLKNSNQENKENNPIQSNAHVQHKLTAVSTKPAFSIPISSQKQITQTEQWIKYELGYEHSLTKSKNSHSPLVSPLLNGTLIGSILMRLQIGKVNLIKDPRDLKEVGKNLQQVGGALARRGYECGRWILSVKLNYQNAISAICSLRQTWNKRENQAKTKISKERKEKLLEIQSHLLSQQEKQDLREWLNTLQIGLPTFPYLPATVLTQLIARTLNLPLYRQTTATIAHSNLQKILQEFRRMGLREYYHVKTEEILQDEQERWKIVKRVCQVLRGVQTD